MDRAIKKMAAIKVFMHDNEKHLNEILHYEQQKIHYSKDENEDLRMVRSIEMGWFVLEKYYNMTDQVPVYASAILLNPASRAAYLKKNWPAEWYEPAINAAQNFG
ncbi:hypothetical protein A1F94_004825 [Pyrenophora tritici-repentis]|nr:hypothetical protein A1F94_004825 [Pyrenophora tritici-repentis]